MLVTEEKEKKKKYRREKEVSSDLINGFDLGAVKKNYNIYR
jgi:hypothetical protein